MRPWCLLRSCKLPLFPAGTIHWDDRRTKPMFVHLGSLLVTHKILLVISLSSPSFPLPLDLSELLLPTATSHFPLLLQLMNHISIVSPYAPYGFMSFPRAQPPVSHLHLPSICTFWVRFSKIAYMKINTTPPSPHVLI